MTWIVKNLWPMAHLLIRLSHLAFRAAIRQFRQPVRRQISNCRTQDLPAASHAFSAITLLLVWGCRCRMHEYSAIGRAWGRPSLLRDGECLVLSIPYASGISGWLANAHTPLGCLKDNPEQSRPLISCAGNLAGMK